MTQQQVSGLIGGTSPGNVLAPYNPPSTDGAWAWNHGCTSLSTVGAVVKGGAYRGSDVFCSCVVAELRESPKRSQILNPALEKNASLAVGEEQCTQTFAQYLGVPWLVFQVVAGALVYLVLIPMLVWRLWKVRVFSRRCNRRLGDVPQTKFFAMGLLIAVSVGIELIDPLGMRDILPIALYNVLDELDGASCIMLGLLITEFWANAAKGFNRRSFPKYTKRVFYGGTVSLLVGFRLYSMSVPERYNFFQGVAGLLTVGILLTLLGLAHNNVKTIQKFLLGMRSSELTGFGATSTNANPVSLNSSSAQSELDELEATNVSSEVSTANNAGTRQGVSRGRDRASVDRVISQLKKKYRFFFGIVLLAVLVLSFTSVVRVTAPLEEQKWEFTVEGIELEVVFVVAFR
ncbi:Hypothetical protein SCF082_LOCUS14048, partial [Durusdinium trenchii]